jgi:hypothetical protein
MTLLRQTQIAHASCLLSILHPAPSAQTLIEITAMAGRNRPVKRYFTDAALAIEFALEFDDMGFSIFVNSNPRSAMSGFEENVPYVTALALDLQPERTSIPHVEAALVQAGIPPAVVAVSGFGAHMYVLVNPVERTMAKTVWSRLCKWTGSDRIFNVNRIMRMPGSRNWKKNPPPWCYLVSANPERRFDLDHVTKCLDRVRAPVDVPPTVRFISTPVNPPEDWFELRKRLDPGTLDIIDTGERNAYSEKQIRAGATADMVAWVYANNPVGTIGKYHEAGERYLTRTIESAQRATAAPVPRSSGRSRDSHKIFTGSSSERYESRYAER